MKRKVLLCVTGSITSYKSVDIAGMLILKGYDVFVLMTENATKFISPLVFQTITRNNVFVDFYNSEIINNFKIFDIILVAPATYNIIGKVACGIADDSVSTVLSIASGKKVIYAPSMSANMYNNPAFVTNINSLVKRGSIIIEPNECIHVSSVFGKERLLNPDDIVDAVDSFFCKKILMDKRVVITAGSTREYIDPVRFISYSSTGGTLGISLAKACRDMGASVSIILANSYIDLNGIEITRVSDVKQMYEASVSKFRDADIFISAAAVNNYKSLEYSQTKIKKEKDKLVLELIRNTDILYELGMLKKRQVIIGVAGESENLIDNARIKLVEKNLDAIIALNLSSYATNDAEAYLITEEKVETLKNQPKETLAYDIMNRIINILHI